MRREILVKSANHPINDNERLLTRDQKLLSTFGLSSFNYFSHSFVSNQFLTRSLSHFKNLQLLVKNQISQFSWAENFLSDQEFNQFHSKSRLRNLIPLHHLIAVLITLKNV